MEREIAGTNSAALAAGENGGAESQSNRVSRTQGRASAENASGNQNTNAIAGANGNSAGNESQSAGNNSQRSQRGERNSANAGQNGNRGQQPNGSGNNGEQASAENQQNGQGGQGETPAENNGQRGNRGGNQQQANNNSPGQQNDPSGREGGAGQRQGGRNGGNANGGGAEGGNTGGGDGLRQFVQQLGRGDRNQDAGGPITGNGYVNWSDRLRDVEQVLDSQDLRNQLATVRERAAVIRGEYRDLGRKPDGEVVRQQILAPLSQVRVWLQEELARKENVNSLVPLDRDPVPENYSELVRKYYEKLGSAQ
jgi:hypothetical protein